MASENRAQVQHALADHTLRKSDHMASEKGAHEQHALADHTLSTMSACLLCFLYGAFQLLLQNLHFVLDFLEVSVRHLVLLPAFTLQLRCITDLHSVNEHNTLE